MNLLDAYTTLVDAARQSPPNRQLNAAIKRVEIKIEAMREQRRKQLERYERAGIRMVSSWDT